MGSSRIDEALSQKPLDQSFSATLKFYGRNCGAPAPSPRDHNPGGRAAYNHFFHLKNIYGPIAAHSIAISAAG